MTVSSIGISYFCIGFLFNFRSVVRSINVSRYAMQARFRAVDQGRRATASHANEVTRSVRFATSMAVILVRRGKYADIYVERT